MMLVVTFSACNKSNESVTDLSIGFMKSKVDVGENSGILDIPIMLSGARKDMALDVDVTIKTKNGTAIEGVDYKLKSDKLKMNRVGEYLVTIEILDNEVLDKVDRTFSVEITSVTSKHEFIKKIAELTVYIVNDDVPQFDYTGSYTMTAISAFDPKVSFTSAAGGVSIVKDATDPMKYHFENLAFVDGNKVFPLTRSTKARLYFTVTNGIASMPMEQNIGNYGIGDGVILSLNETMNVSTAPVVIKEVGGKLTLNVYAIAGIYTDKDGKMSAYYAYRNVILVKTN